jgi:hypothetical protein
MGKLQLSLLDLFWITGLIACVIGAVTTDTAEVAWIGVGCLLLFVWNRPVLLRLWTVGIIGIGTGLTVAGATGDRVLRMYGSQLTSWGAAMIVAGVVAFIVFDIRRPTALQ